MKKTLVALVLGSTLLAGCGPRTYETELRDILQKEYSMTPEESEVGVVGGLRPKYGTHEEKAGKDKWQPNYESVTIDQRIKQHKQMAEDLDMILSFKNKENTQLVEEFQIREQLEQDEKAILFNLNKLNLVSLYQQFGKLMGLNEEEAQKVDEAMLIYPLAPLEEQLKFEAKYVTEARKTNQLTVVDDLLLGYKYNVEIPNPAYPEVDKTHQTVWQTKQVLLRIVSYDVDSPIDHKTDYMEVFRGNEKQPAMKIFHSASSNALDVAVIDYDREGERGYGIPDEVINVSNFTRAIELFDNGRNHLEKLFQERKKQSRVRPQEKEMNITIVRVGELKDEPCEQNLIDGFSVPFEYMQKDGKNYTVAYKVKSLKDDDKEFSWTARRYRIPNSMSEDVVGRVVAYYKIKPEYRSHIENVIVDGQRMTISRTGLVDVAGPDSLFLEKEPYRITYDFGQSRYSIEDKDNKLPKYESRCEHAKPMFHELDTLEKEK